jgi:hypothetical protein
MAAMEWQIRDSRALHAKIVASTARKSRYGAIQTCSGVFCGLVLSSGGSVSQESREVILQVLTIEITKISKAERLQACPGRPDWSQHFCPLPHRGTPKLKEQVHLYEFVERFRNV